MAIAQEPKQEYRAKVDYVGNLWKLVEGVTGGYRTDKGFAIPCTFQDQQLIIEVEKNHQDNHQSIPSPKSNPLTYVLANSQQQANDLAQKIEQESSRLFMQQAGISQD